MRFFRLAFIVLLIGLLSGCGQAIGVDEVSDLFDDYQAQNVAYGKFSDGKLFIDAELEDFDEPVDVKITENGIYYPKPDGQADFVPVTRYKLLESGAVEVTLKNNGNSLRLIRKGESVYIEINFGRYELEDGERKTGYTYLIYEK